MLEFEPIYKAEAEARMKAGKKTLSTNGAEGKGQSRDFMARDSAASKNSVERVLYINAHDPELIVPFLYPPEALNGAKLSKHATTEAPPG
jgi:hypothetical protein